MNRIFKAGFAVSVLSVTALVLAAASKPKATGDVQWVNTTAGTTGGTPAHVVFNAIATNDTGDAKGSLLYEDGTYAYTMDVQFLRVDGKTAWFAGQVTANLTADSEEQKICCAVGHWIFYKVEDNGEPGIYDLIWGADLTAVDSQVGSSNARTLVMNDGTPGDKPFQIKGGNLQVHK